MRDGSLHFNKPMPFNTAKLEVIVKRIIDVGAKYLF